MIKINQSMIEDEKEIPETYRQDIEKRLNTKDLIINVSKIIPGKINKSTSGKDLLSIFGDSEQLYFGHGTGDSKESIELIVKEGLRVKNPEKVIGYDSHLRGLTSTTIGFGFGGDEVFLENEQLLNNWPHKESKKIIILALPKKYYFPLYEVRAQADCYEQFYIGNEEDGYYIRPEFILGIYNSSEKSFYQNENFYKSIDLQKQKKLFAELDQKYIRYYAKNVITNPGEKDLPIDDKLKDSLIIEWYAEQLKLLREYKDSMSNTNELTDMLDEVSDTFDGEKFDKWI